MRLRGRSADRRDPVPGRATRVGRGSSRRHEPPGSAAGPRAGAGADPPGARAQGLTRRARWSSRGDPPPHAVLDAARARACAGAPAQLGAAGARGVALARAGLGMARRRGGPPRQLAASDAAGPGATLGVDPDGEPVLLADRQLSAHGLIVGASGAGKSTTLLRILTEQMRRGLPVSRSTSRARRRSRASSSTPRTRRGRPVPALDSRRAEHWNPLAHGNATELKDKLIATERFTEPHFQRAAERYVQTGAAGDERPIRTARRRSPSVVSLMEPRRLARLTRGLHAPLAARVLDYLAGLTPDQLSAIRGLGDAAGDRHRVARRRVPRRRTRWRSTCARALAAASRPVQPQFEHLRQARGSARDARRAGPGQGDRPPPRARGRRAAAQAIVAIDEFSALGTDNVSRCSPAGASRASRAARHPGAGRPRARRPRLPRPGASA